MNATRPPPTAAEPHLASLAHDAGTLVPPLIEALGRDRFGPTLAHYLHALCGADRFAAFRLEGDGPHAVVASCVQPGHTALHVIERYVHEGLWQRDVVMNEARQAVSSGAASVIHADFSDQHIHDQASQLFPQVRDRIVLCGQSSGVSFGLSVLRTGPRSPFPKEALLRFMKAADAVIALLAKHVAITRLPTVAQALTSLPRIESCLAAMGALPRREAEVCARILYGVSSAGIAAELTLSEETVRTYRKRVYQRLSIGSERELLKWYLERWYHWEEQRLGS